MLNAQQKVCIHFADSLGKINGKMGYGFLRYAENPVVCVIDRQKQGQQLHDILEIGENCPVVADIRQAIRLGAEVLLLGMAPSGGKLSATITADVDQAIAAGLCVINGLHSPLNPRYPQLRPEQWIWDIRVEPTELTIASGQAARLPNKRLLLVGTDMAIGKMTVGLELFHLAKKKQIDAAFLATGQIGMCITGKGIPLDAIRLDYACGAVEQLVLADGNRDLLIIEGQGSLLHPGSSATLPLLRGACPTHLVFCHQANKTTLSDHPIEIPPLADLIALYQDLAHNLGAYPRPQTIAVALNTYGLSGEDAIRAINGVEQETGLYTTDVVRYNAEGILARL